MAVEALADAGWHQNSCSPDVAAVAQAVGGEAATVGYKTPVERFDGCRVTGCSPSQVDVAVDQVVALVWQAAIGWSDPEEFGFSQLLRALVQAMSNE